MKRAAVALTLLLAAPVSAQAPVLTPQSEHLYYAWLTLTPKQVATALYRDLKPTLPKSAGLRRNVLRCLTGATEQISQNVRQLALVGGVAPDALIRNQVGTAVDLCVRWGVQGAPTRLLPPAPEPTPPPSE